MLQKVKSTTQELNKSKSGITLYEIMLRKAISFMNLFIHIYNYLTFSPTTW